MSDVAKTERLVIITAGLLFLAVVVSILIDKISEKIWIGLQLSRDMSKLWKTG